MPQPAGTNTLQDVITFVKKQFGDEAAIQIDDGDIARWTNMAMLEIVSKSTLVLEAVSTSLGVVGQTEYSYPADIISVYSVTYGNKILSATGYEQYIEAIGENAGQLGNPQYWAHWANNFYIWPIPNVARTMTIRYSKHPATVSGASDPIELPSRYYPRITDYVLSKAQELDEDFAASAASRSLFEQKMAELDNAPDSMYGQNHVIDDIDSWKVW